jgi:hypothetical protein
VVADVRRAVSFVAAVSLMAACDSGTSGHDTAPLSPPAHVVVGGAPSATPHTLELVQGVSVLNVRVGETGGRLYRVQTPIATASYPVLHVVGTTVQVSSSGAGNASLTVVVASTTPWLVLLRAGVSTASIDMHAGRLRGLSASAGVSTLDITAGAPSGNVAVTESGGVSALALHVPATTPVAVNVHGGAGSVSLFGTTHSGVAAGATFSSGSGANHYTIDAEGGASDITVDST